MPEYTYTDNLGHVVTLTHEMMYNGPGKTYYKFKHYRKKQGRKQYYFPLPVDRRPKFRKFGAYSAKKIKDYIRQQTVRHVAAIMES